MEKTKKSSLIIRSILGIFISIGLITLALIFAKESFQIDQVYIEENSIVYHLDESGVVTSLEITVTNLSYSTEDNKDLILRYCREDSYPEGYTSPIIYSLKPMESRTIVISNFRNTWYYNSDYHIEVEAERGLTPLLINVSAPLRLYRIVSTVLFPVSLICLIIFIVKLVKVCKIKNKEI